MVAVHVLGQSECLSLFLQILVLIAQLVHQELIHSEKVVGIGDRERLGRCPGRRQLLDFGPGLLGDFVFLAEIGVLDAHRLQIDIHESHDGVVKCQLAVCRRRIAAHVARFADRGLFHHHGRLATLRPHSFRARRQASRAWGIAFAESREAESLDIGSDQFAILLRGGKLPIGVEDVVVPREAVEEFLVGLFQLLEGQVFQLLFRPCIRGPTHRRHATLTQDAAPRRRPAPRRLHHNTRRRPADPRRLQTRRRPADARIIVGSSQLLHVGPIVPLDLQLGVFHALGKIRQRRHQTFVDQILQRLRILEVVDRLLHILVERRIDNEPVLIHDQLAAAFLAVRPAFVAEDVDAGEKGQFLRALQFAHGIDAQRLEELSHLRLHREDGGDHEHVPWLEHLRQPAGPCMPGGTMPGGTPIGPTPLPAAAPASAPASASTSFLPRSS